MAKTKIEKEYKKNRNTAIAAGIVAGGAAFVMVQSGRKAYGMREEARSAKASRRIDKKSGRRR